MRYCECLFSAFGVSMDSASVDSASVDSVPATCIPCIQWGEAVSADLRHDVGRAPCSGDEEGDLAKASAGVHHVYGDTFDYHLENACEVKRYTAWRGQC